MVASFLVVMSLAVPDPAALVDRASRRLSPQRWSLPASSDAPRIAVAPSHEAGRKERALGEDGQQCSVVGARVCTNPPRTWVSADF